MKEPYQTSRIKRARATRAEVAARRQALLDIVAEGQPMTVRQVFYQATVRGLVEKSEAGYGKVQNDLVVMRRECRLPYAWITDHTRWRRQPETWSSPEEALVDAARVYRKALWRDADAYVEFWLEKEALAGVLLPVTDLYDVPLMVARGYPSLSFLHGAAEAISLLCVPAHIYHFGDYDPSGVNAAETTEARLREMAPAAEIVFTRVAVTKQQISELSLPTRPTKKSDSRSKGFGVVSVELDAIEPNQLRSIAEQCIQQHLPIEQLEILQAIEERERDLLFDFVKQIQGAV